ncbi:hypothetical protein ONZ51_g11723 [Trametes cubensis]|uniref:Nephrocystin 3-like N-terminal domain-containing protein n=1 Tax=Trametes cubensis TaxID=1111947 RepID=A0AAD7TJX2_9APHY|nr:hypothetical protein ONZ51_g11723 [Trametes cubensis]
MDPVRKDMKRRESPAPSAPLSPIPTDTQPTGDSRGERLVKKSLSHLIPALTSMKEVSSACPQLQSAVGVLLVVLEAYKNYSETTEAIGTLLSRIQSLNEQLGKVRSEDSCPPELKERLVSLAGQLQEVVGNAKKVQSKGRIVRFLRATEYVKRTESWVKQLDQHINDFLVGGVVAVEVAVHVGEIIDIHRLSLQLIIALPSLRPAVEAMLHSESSVHVPCHENTRKEVLAELCSWLQPEDPRPEQTGPAPLNRPILWLHALAGSGKSTIALTVADRWERGNLLGASFFCARDGDRSNINTIFRTIAYQLAFHSSAFREHLTMILETHPDLYSSSPTRQLEKLIVEPLETLRADVKGKEAYPTRVAIIIDALDECTDTAAVSVVLKSLASYIARLSPLRFLVTSRPEENITRGFLLQNIRENTQDLALNQIPNDLTRRDISSFLQSRLDEIRDNFALDASWPAPQHLENLVSLSGLLFIFAAAAARYIEDQAERDPENRLTSLLRAGNAAAERRSTSTSPFPILDMLYIQVLENAARRLGDVLKVRLNLILGTIVLAEQRISPTTLEALLDLPPGTVGRVLPVLSAILTFPNGGGDPTPIGIIHLSFPNFLVDPIRCTNQSFLIRPHVQHSHIALRCLKLMKALKYDILGVASKQDRILNNEIPDLEAKISQHLPAALQYACRYWTRHLCEAEVGEDLLTALEEFCKCHLLHWLEALSILGCVEGAVEALQTVQTYLKASYPTVHLQSQSLRETDILSLLYDCERALRAFYPIIATSAMHMYSTIAVFAPLDTPIRRLATANGQTSLLVRDGLENTWSTTLVSRVIDESSINTLAFSPDGKCVSCAKRDGTIQLLNAHTGAELQLFKNHANNQIRGLSFSPTSKELLSGSNDGAVNLWDVATGANLGTWKAHSDWVRSVVWSPDGTLAASASQDRVVRVWRMTSPEKMVMLRHGGWVRDVAFAQDGDLLSGSDDKTCKVWDTRSMKWDTEADMIEPLQTLEHDSLVMAVAVSSDSRLVACGINNGEIVLWTKSDGQPVRSLQGQSQVTSLAFYPSGLLAAAYSSSPITLWDVSTGAPVNTASNAGASAAAFASDGLHIAHATDGQVHIHLWPSELKQKAARSTTIAGKLKHPTGCSSVEVGEPLGSPLTSLKAAATSLIRRLVLAVHEDELRIYEISTGRCMRTLGHSSDDRPCAAWSPTGRLFACTGRDHGVHVWEANTGELVGSFTHHLKDVAGLVFTRDEQYVLSASKDGTIRRGKIEQNDQQSSSEILFRSLGGVIFALDVSSDGQWILSASSRRKSPPDISSAHLLAPASRQPVKSQYGYYNTLRLHHAVTGRVVWIEHHPCKITSVAFYEDCTRALVGNREGEVFLYDLTQLIPSDPVVPYSPPSLPVPEHKLSRKQTRRPVLHISFSPDGLAAIANTGAYIPIPPELQPLHAGSTNRPSTTLSLDEDGWLLNSNPDSDSRRLCWIPPSFHPGIRSTGSLPSPSGYSIAYMTSQGSLVFMEDTSAC